MKFESASCPQDGVTYAFEPPIDLLNREVAALPSHDLNEVLAVHLAGRRGPEAVREMAHRIFVITEVAPNPTTLGRHLTELSGGKPRVRPQRPFVS